MSPSLRVYYDTHLVGHLSLTVHGRMNFKYDEHWLENSFGFPISISLPFQKDIFEEEQARSFFSNLLPEGDIRRFIAQRFGCSPENDFKLLEAIGGDCAGALSLLPEDQSISMVEDYRSLSLDQLDRMIGDRPQRPLIAEGKDLRLSLAGAQHKLPVYREEDFLFLPYGRAASTHILKPAVANIPESIENEIFCMKLAAKAGLAVPVVEIMNTPNHSVFCVARYDRKILDKRKVQKLHQEDFCQALGVRPDQKYQNEGGPSLKKVFETIHQHSSQPAKDKKRLLEWVIFNFIIGNNDAHGKNISLMLSRESVALAPFYDLMSTAVYENLSRKMAMRIGGEYDSEMVFERHWERLSEEMGVKENFVIKLLAEMKKKIRVGALALSNDFKKSNIIQRIVLHIQKNTGAT